MDSKQKRLIDIARRIAAGLPVNVTPEERLEAQELIVWNERTHRSEAADGSPGQSGIQNPTMRHRSRK